MEIGEDMGTLEIILLAAGAVVFIASFCIPVKQEKLKEETKNLAAQEVKDLVSEELENVRGRLSEISEEEMHRQIEKSERSMERISNEKIMAVNEYSDTVLDEIHKNHEEVIFLYDMMKGKKESLSESYDKADRNIQDLLQQVKDAEITVRENLEEITKQQKAPGGRKAENSGHAASGRKKAPQGRREAAPAGQEAADARAEEARMENMLSTVESAFQPFVAEKVEVVPKKKNAGKGAKKQEAEKAGKAASKEPAESQAAPAEQEKKAAPADLAENMDAARLLSDPADAENNMINSNKRILELHRAGKSNMSIARELGLGVGEVKLVIDLYE